ncbi:helix-turn-helix domain-containing protein [Planotetraspora mira]|uniref:Helix-turn-helix transcriptional regulator n=1 Tax=Planotetraspora mira TaxID=58121 RepID=A0A8J3XDP4_9ACTN|nr:helix-turn-helix transcriptional regulator [Planotetraspora mira]GII32688.1 helix-turn-helix transcriptional regulator [Planotetraspora mira]
MLERSLTSADATLCAVPCRTGMYQSGGGLLFIHMEDPRDKWPFGGRGAELDLIREALHGDRRGIVVTAGAGAGRSRLAAESVAGLPHAWVTGTRGTAPLRFAAFAHLLPGAAADSLSRAVDALRPVRVLVVDDAHLLDDASAALVHHLVANRRARVLLTLPGGAAAPDAVLALGRQHMLSHLRLGPLPATEVTQVLSAVLGDHVEALTAQRLRRVSDGNLWLLRELVVATREAGMLRRVNGVWRWRGAVPMTGRLRDLVGAAMGEVDGAEREALELVAFGEPVDATAAGTPVAPLERLEARGLVVTDDALLVRLAHPLFGPAVRAGVGRLRALRLSRTARPQENLAAALSAQCAELTALGHAGDVTQVVPGIGERLTEEDEGWDEPGMVDFCARRAWIARLRGELREAVAWSTEGLRRSPLHGPCLAELACSATQSGDLLTAEDALGRWPQDSLPEFLATPASFLLARAWVFATRGEQDAAVGSALAAARACRSGARLPDGLFALHSLARSGAAKPGPPLAPHGDGRFTGPGSGELFALHDVVRLGAPGLVADRLRRLADTLPGDLAPLLADHAAALVAADGPALDKVARRLADLGLLLHAAEAAGHAAKAHRDTRSADASIAYASTLAQACQGAHTPALLDLATPRLTPRQRQIAGLAAAGLTNREIAKRLGLSIRTVANQLCRAYENLGSSDRTALRRLISLASG